MSSAYHHTQRFALLFYSLTHRACHLVNSNVSEEELARPSKARIWRCVEILASQSPTECLDRGSHRATGLDEHLSIGPVDPATLVSMLHSPCSGLPSGR